jgi:hypothetical protein
MRIARLNHWSPAVVFGFDEAELLVAEEEARLSTWGPLEEMLALLVEKVSDLYSLTWQAHNTKKGAKPPDTVHIGRPGEEVEEPKRMSWVELATQMRREGHWE